MLRHAAGLALALHALAAPQAQAQTQTVEDFYRGKRLTLTVGYGPGGGYDVFARLLTFPNVLVTAHQAFFTSEALAVISETTLRNVTAFERGERSGNELF